MTTVGASGVGAAGAVGRRDGGGGGANTREALGKLAADVAGTIGAELGVAVDPDARRAPFQPAADLYGIEELAASLAERLHATPQEAGEIARLLHLFAAAVAARVGAAPDSRSLEQIERLVAGLDATAKDATGAILLIGRAVRALEA